MNASIGETWVATTFYPQIWRLCYRKPETAGHRRVAVHVCHSNLFQTRRKFWLDEQLSGSATTDVGNTMVFDGAPNQSSAQARGILESYMGGLIARQAAAIPESQRVEWVMRIVEKAYPNLRRNFEVGATKCWDLDKWARGGYAWFKPGQMTSLLPHVARPEGRIHFAGEHASSLFGWMQGALESGNRAAQEINQADS